MDHIPDNDLARFAFQPDTLSSERRSEIRSHTTACEYCRTIADFFALADDDLVWERTVGSATRDTLSAYAAQFAKEDKEAEALLQPLFENPAKAAWTNIATKKKFLTGGVVRRLTTHAHEIFENQPLDALTFADAAVSVAEGLQDDAYPAKAVFEWRGAAWKERANSLMLLGRCDEALESLTYAEQAYRRLNSPGLGLACVALARASVLYQQQQLDEATALAERAEHGFKHLGDDERAMTALYLRAGIYYEAGQIDRAASLFHQVVAHGEAIKSLRWFARGSYMLGNCEIDRGNIGEASLRFHAALPVFREIGPANERISTEWGIARLLLHAGKYDEAIRRLIEVAAEFEARGMITDAALVNLDRIDALLALGRTERIVELASRLFHVFTAAHMLTSALTAFSYIKEAAAAGTLTRTTLQAVRQFIRRARHQQDLLFQPPSKNL